MMRRCASKYLRYTVLRFSANVPCVNERAAAVTRKTHPAVKNTLLPPMALFDSIVKNCPMEPDVVVKALEKVRNNTSRLTNDDAATNAGLVIDRTIPLVEAGDARGKQQALVLFALLINGADHGGMMRRLKEAVTSDEVESVVAARFQAFLATFAPPGSMAQGFISLAPDNFYTVSELERLIPKERVNVLTYLAQAKELFESNFFKGRKIWRLADDMGFRRHIEVELMAQDATVSLVRCAMFNRTALLYGESGSGKTSTAILSCEEGDLCIFMTPQLFVNGKPKPGEVGSQLKADREAFSKKYKELSDGKDSGIVIPELPGTICAVLEQRIRKTIPNYESLEEFPGNVVLVVDEVGKHVINVMAKKGFVALAELLNDKKPTSASYYHNMSIKPTSLAYVQRLMLNRRLCAALLSELDQSLSQDSPSETSHRDDNIPWLTVLPVYASSALVKFKRLNRLQNLSWDATLTLFARALAYCFGGAHQAIDGATKLQRELGMITDNARECDSDQVDVSISKLSVGKWLALPRGSPHFGRRVQISPAAVEMGLQRFSLSTVARARTDAAFETTVTDWIYCWCLACCSDVPTITLLGEKGNFIEAVRLAQDIDDTDKVARQAVLTVMMRMRNALRASQPKTAVVLRVSLTGKVESVAAAEVAAFAEAWALIGKADVPFVLVAQNAPKASFADVFVVAGRTCQPSVDGANTASVTKGITTALVAIQAKHYAQSPFKATAADDEHNKQEADALTPTTGLFNSLVLVLHPNDRGFESSSVEKGDETTVWIRHGALASVMHPITLGAGPQEASRSSDAEKCDLRNQEQTPTD